MLDWLKYRKYNHGISQISSSLLWSCLSWWTLLSFWDLECVISVMIPSTPVVFKNYLVLWRALSFTTTISAQHHCNWTTTLFRQQSSNFVFLLLTVEWKWKEGLIWMAKIYHHAPYSILLFHTFAWGFLTETLSLPCRRYTTRFLLILPKAALNQIFCRTTDDSAPSHGYLVVKHMLQSAQLQNFEKLWRQRFVDTMKPKFLHDLWRIDYDHLKMSM